MAMNLRDLYHPGGLPRQASEFAPEPPPCHCGCAPRNGNCAPEELGIAGTPGLLAVAELKRRERASAPERAAKGDPWRGAVREAGEVTLPDDMCRDPACTRPHVERYGIEAAVWGPPEFRYRFHVRVLPARVARIGSAVLRLRTDRRLPRGGAL